MNVVMTGAERFVEVQGTAERTPFDQAQLDGLLALARQGVARLLALPAPGARRPDDDGLHALVTPRLLLATANAGKVRELVPLLDGLGYTLTSLRDHPAVRLPPEGETSYRENALEKARAAAARRAGGRGARRRLGARGGCASTGGRAWPPPAMEGRA